MGVRKMRYQWIRDMSVAEMEEFFDRFTQENPYCRRATECVSEALEKEKAGIPDDECRTCIAVYLRELVEEAEV